MKPKFPIHQTLSIAFCAVAIIAIAAFSSGYAGRVNFSIGPNGINFELGPGS